MPTPGILSALGFGALVRRRRAALARERERKERSRLDRLTMANSEGTGLLQRRLPFEDVDALLDPQRGLALSLSTVQASDDDLELSRTFEYLRGRQRGGRSGFLETAERDARLALSRQREQSLFEQASSFVEQRNQMLSENEDAEAYNRSVFFDVFGDDIYDEIRRGRSL